MYFAGNNYLWSQLHLKIGVKVGKSLSEYWLKNDMDRENRSLREEVTKRQNDILKIPYTSPLLV